MLYEISNKYIENRIFFIRVLTYLSDFPTTIIICLFVQVWGRWDIVVLGWHEEWHDAYVKSYFYSKQHHECKNYCLWIIKCFIWMNAWNQLLYIYFGYQSIENLFKFYFCTCHGNRYNIARYDNYTGSTYVIWNKNLV